MLLNTAGTVIPDYDPEVSISVSKFVDQLPAVFNQVLWSFLNAILPGIQSLLSVKLQYCFCSGCLLKTLFLLWSIKCVHAVRLLKGFQSSSQNHLKISTVPRSHTIFSKRYWY